MERGELEMSWRERRRWRGGGLRWVGEEGEDDKGGAGDGLERKEKMNRGVEDGMERNEKMKTRSWR